MYPCSNPELVAAVSEAGGLGVVQPISLTYVHGYDFREGLKFIRQLTQKPIGMNALIEKSSNTYMNRMAQWIDIALEEGVRFFITSLGKPDWVVQRVHALGGVVYHDVTEQKWAIKAVEAGVDGLIAVNNRAGGHAGNIAWQVLYKELCQYKLPLICAGGIGTPSEFKQVMQFGYDGAQLGTRFIATTQCNASHAYKQAIVQAKENDIVLTQRLTGVPVSVIKNPYIEKIGLRAGRFARWMLKGPKTKHWMRTLYAINSFRGLKKSSFATIGNRDYWQAGKSVSGIHSIEDATDVVQAFAAVIDDRWH